METMASTMTGDLGQFRLPSLMRGRYRVCVASTHGGELAIPVGYTSFDEPSRDGYPGTCIPGADTKTLLDLAPGQQQELDFALSQRRLVDVSGKITNPLESEPVAIHLDPMDPSSGTAVLTALVQVETHGFRFANVPPGRYWVTAQISRNVNSVQTELSAREQVIVGDSPTSGVESTLEPPPTIDVVVHAPEHAGESPSA